MHDLTIHIIVLKTNQFSCIRTRATRCMTGSISFIFSLQSVMLFWHFTFSSCYFSFPFFPLNFTHMCKISYEIDNNQTNWSLWQTMILAIIFYCSCNHTMKDNLKQSTPTLFNSYPFFSMLSKCFQLFRNFFVIQMTSDCNIKHI